jgi:hypothetical protein
VVMEENDYNYNSSNGGPSYYDSTVPLESPPYECACPEFDEFNFFTWMSDFFAWLGSLLNFMG